MKIVKFFVVFNLILSISLINSVAAISVSDGSAFVTKAEFAADLNNLSNRMSTLENSLDAKIDSLVSSYLSRNGIWNGEKQELTNDKISFPEPKKLGVSESRSFSDQTTTDKTKCFKPSKSGLAFIRTSVVSTYGNSYQAYWGYRLGAKRSGSKNLWDDALTVSIEFSDSKGILATMGLYNGGASMSSFSGGAVTSNFMLIYPLPGEKQYNNVQFFIEKDVDIYWRFVALARHGYTTSEMVGAGNGVIELISATVY